ncbi:MAG TPA: hypothetical protein PKI19_09875, partial [Elusimicrobiales bacterium]|nr:hypothetical protein [Elusimicrobiales bacterium]
GALLPAVRGPGGSDLSQAIFPRVLQFCSYIAVLALTGSIVSKDLGRGYYRAFFSRPIDPGGYYLLRWLLGALVFDLFVALLSGIAVWKIGASLPIGHYLAQLTLEYFILGGLVFLLSALSVPGDAAVAVPLCFMSAWAHNTDGWLASVSWLLPPLHLVSVSSAPQPGESAWQAVLYGTVTVAAAVAVLQHRRFAEGGRGD